MIHAAQSVSKLLELISKLSKFAGKKVNTQTSIVFLKSHNKELEN